MNIHYINEQLTSIFHDFSHRNKKNPFNEFLFIICSLKTHEKLYERTYLTLKKKFPKNESILYSSVDEIEKSIFSGGLSKQKAIIIYSNTWKIFNTFGKVSLSPLKYYSDEKCESFLTSLRGVGIKTARCIMMYSLQREVFPVDTHVWKISKRLGWIINKIDYQNCRKKEMDELQSIIPLKCRFSLHVNMISLGRKYCHAKKPNCAQCPISELCPKYIIG